MEVTLLLCSSAAPHPDGTVSMLRVGINRAWGKLPVPFNGSLVIRIEANPGESGNHAMEIKALDADGKDAGLRIEGGFDVPVGGGVSNLIIGFSAQFPKYGRYAFYVNIDKQNYKTWPFDITENKPEKKS